MIFSSLSKYMLKYQKAKAKLVEYDVAHEDYPKFNRDSNTLFSNSFEHFLDSS